MHKKKKKNNNMNKSVCVSKKKCVSVVVVPNDPKVVFHIQLISVFHTYVSPISVCTMKFTGALLSSEIWEEFNVFSG